MTYPAGRWSKTSSTPLRSRQSRRRVSAMADSTNRPVLVINSGSSSLKYELVEPDSGIECAGGGIQQIGEPSSRVADHEEALRLAFDQMAEAGVDLKSCGLLAVGHRVVHGGQDFYRPTI